MSEQIKYPIQEYRAGKIKVAIWENKIQQDNETVLRHSIQIQKSYRKKDGTWQDSDTFFPEDLPNLQLVIQKAYEFIALKQ